MVKNTGEKKHGSTQEVRNGGWQKSVKAVLCEAKDDRKLAHLGKLLNSVCAEGMNGDTDGKGGRVLFGKHREASERIEERSMTR